MVFMVNKVLIPFHYKDHHFRKYNLIILLSKMWLFIFTISILTMLFLEFRIYLLQNELIQLLK
ncbi:MAG: hypothetical protein K0Q49_474 [Haloplasmataceae bacterium]|jgi:hypothetical protein|nr:hypothetical protein [Haloplasmataceae bacterium]